MATRNQMQQTGFRTATRAIALSIVATLALLSSVGGAASETSRVAEFADAPGDETLWTQAAWNPGFGNDLWRPQAGNLICRDAFVDVVGGSVDYQNGAVTVTLTTVGTEESLMACPTPAVPRAWASFYVDFDAGTDREPNSFVRFFATWSRSDGGTWDHCVVIWTQRSYCGDPFPSEFLVVGSTLKWSFPAAAGSGAQAYDLRGVQYALSSFTLGAQWPAGTEEPGSPFVDVPAAGDDAKGPTFML